MYLYVTHNFVIISSEIKEGKSILIDKFKCLISKD